MARASPQSQPYNRSSSTSSRHSRHPSSSSSIGTTSDIPTNNIQQSKTSNNRNNNTHLSSSSSSSMSSILPSILAFPLVLIHFLYSILKIPFTGLYLPKSSSNSRRGGGIKDDEHEQNNNNPADATNDLPALSIDSDADLDTIKSVLSKDSELNSEEYLTVMASPALTTLLDDALYRAYQAELVPTVAAASQLLTTFIEMKEASALLLRECRWMGGVPMSGGLAVIKGTKGRHEVAVCREKNSIYLGEGAIVDRHGNAISLEVLLRGSSSSAAADSSSVSSSSSNDDVTEQLHSEEMTRWNEFDTIQDFAQHCYLGANEAIQRLTTDRLAESANLTLHDSIASVGTEGDTSGGGGGDNNDTLQQPSSSQTQPPSPSAAPIALSPADAGIGRCYHSQPRRTCWESPRLYCPDYYWADDAIGGCQRLLKTLSKHRFVTLVGTHGWDRYSAIKPKVVNNDPNKRHAKITKKEKDLRYIHAPTYAACSPHVFPSLEAVHSLQYLVSELLPNAIPSRLNQFRAAVESNAVVSKRLYLVKCEYRAPMRALWESYMSLNAAPKVELVARYLRDYHGVKIGEKSGESDAAAAAAGGNSGEGASGSKSTNLRRKGSTEVTKKSAIQQQREKLEVSMLYTLHKIITEKYWKHPAFVEALQLERCCERMEIEMSQMLLPLSNLATEIMNEWKGRLRAVAMVQYPGHDEEENTDDNESGHTDNAPRYVQVLLGWEHVPFMRELLRRLKSILRRKPDIGESTGIRPLLLDLQGVPRHKQDAIDSSIEMPFYPVENKTSLFEWPASKTREEKEVMSPDHEWFHLEQFLLGVHKLLKLLTIPNLPFLVEERMAGSKGDKNTMLDLIEQCKEEWDEDMFRAQYKDWFDMVKRQQELNAGGSDPRMAVNSTEDPPTSLSELSETIREAEIELSIAMASKDQLERVHKRLGALRADKSARYKVLRHIVFDIGFRELNDGILVEPPADDATVEFPKLSEPGVFGDQLTLSGEVLPV
ncbi:hypothetical protein ACHAXR_006037, partial [Thalassiosira sp. AJA248-18]